MKKILKYKNYIYPIVILVIMLLAVKLQLINLDSLTGTGSESIHFNLITTNAVFAGFLFTSITFFVGVNTTKTIEILERIDYMENVYSNLNFGFISSLVSITFSLISIFIMPSITGINFVKNSFTCMYILNTIVPTIVLTSLIYTIIKFLIALKELKFIISSIRRKSKLNYPNKESIDNTLKQIK